MPSSIRESAIPQSNHTVVRGKPVPGPDEMAVCREICLRAATEVIDIVQELREVALAQIKAKEKRRRQWWNQKLCWLPRRFRYSLDYGVVDHHCSIDVLKVVFKYAKVVNACLGLMSLCEINRRPVVYIPKKDWEALAPYLKNSATEQEKSATEVAL